MTYTLTVHAQEAEPYPDIESFEDLLDACRQEAKEIVNEVGSECGPLCALMDDLPENLTDEAAIMEVVNKAHDAAAEVVAKEMAEELWWNHAWRDPYSRPHTRYTLDEDPDPPDFDDRQAAMERHGERDQLDYAHNERLLP